MIDTHAHLDFLEYDEDREEVIRRAFNNDIKAIINIGVDLERSQKSIEIAEKHEGVFASVGLHPEYFNQNAPTPPSRLGRDTSPRAGEEVFRKLKKMARHEKVVAIGETGLDYYRVTCNAKLETREVNKIKENQRRGFIAQIELARELSLPVIVHCREAWSDLFEIVNQKSKIKNQKDNSKFKKLNNRKLSTTKFVLHCYSGNREDTEKFLKLPNIYFSFSGNITYPKPADRADMLADDVRMIPLDRIMLDSDSPFLAPQKIRGKRNEPTNIRYIATRIAEIKEISEDNIIRATDRNAKIVFGI